VGEDCGEGGFSDSHFCAGHSLLSTLVMLSLSTSLIFSLRMYSETIVFWLREKSEEEGVAFGFLSSSQAADTMRCVEEVRDLSS
jgi:hypothetical protein